jgi:hypothetical protein
VVFSKRRSHRLLLLAILPAALILGFAVGSFGEDRVAYWQFDETTGALASDWVGGHDAAIVGDPSWIAGVHGTALALDGNDDSAVVPFSTAFDFDDQDFSIAAWIRTTQCEYGTEDGRIVSYGGTVYNDYILGCRGTVFFHVAIVGLGDFVIESEQTVCDGEWHHVVGVRDNASNEMWLYIDGELAASGPGGAGALKHKEASRLLTIGKKTRSDGTNFAHFPGDLDEISIYGVALTGTEVRKLYDGPPSVASADDIVFSSERTGNHDIWRMSRDGSSLWQLTYSPSREDYPHWNGDGTRIAYTNWGDGIHIMDPDGAGDVVVPNTDGKTGALGPDLVVDWGPCENILFSSEEPSDGWGGIYEVAPDGSGRRRLTDGSDGDHPMACWSSDCTMFAWSNGIPYVGETNLSISPVSTFLPDPIHMHDSHPAEWSRDGAWILFGKACQLWRIRPDGTGAADLGCSCMQDSAASYMSDDTRFVFSDGAHLWIGSADLGPIARVSNSSYDELRPDVLKLGSPNATPTADAGPNQEVEQGDLVVLDGTGSSDPDFDPLDYSWTFVTKPQASAAVLSDPSSAIPTFIADQEGTYTLQLEVADGSGASDTDQVVVNAGGLMGYWTFEGNLQDVSGNERHGSVSIGSPTYIPGRTGLGIRMTDDRASIPWDHDDWDAFTVDIWFYLQNMSTGCGQCTDSDGCNIWMDEELNGPGTYSHVAVGLYGYRPTTDDFLGLSFICDDGNSGTVSGMNYVGGVPQYEWHHVVMTAELGGVARAYYDNQLVGSWPQASWGTPGDILYLGGRDFRDDNLLTDGILDELRIYNQVVAPTPSPPTATFTYAPECVIAGAPVDFADTSTDDGIIAGWSWNFGDDSTSDEQNPNHAYAAPGTYMATLTVTDNDGESDSTSEEIRAYLRGDLDGDDDLSVIDVLMLYRYVYGVINLDSCQQARADIDQDDDVDEDDAQALADTVFGP